MSIIVRCNPCGAVIADDDTDAVFCGRSVAGARMDVCGGCMRAAARRVRELTSGRDLRNLPMPRTVAERARDMRLPERLDSSKPRR